jgi:hypothetical protein
MLGFKHLDLKQTRFYQDVFAEGEAAMLLRLLERKFRPLPESARQRVASADAETLFAWGERPSLTPTAWTRYGGIERRLPCAGPVVQPAPDVCIPAQCPACRHLQTLPRGGCRAAPRCRDFPQL